MKPPPFAYEQAGSLAHTLNLLAQHGSEARPLAGGQSLLPMLALRLARPTILVDIGRLDELSGVNRSNGELVLGATVRQRQVAQNPEIVQVLPLLVAATRLIGHPAIRNWGTIGGSLAHADPAAEYPAVMVALDATFVAQGPKGEHEISARDFFLGPFTTALEDTELLTRIRIPRPRPGTGWGIEEVARRHGDFALAGAVVVLERSVEGTCRRVAIAVIGANARPVRAMEAEQALAGQPLTAPVLREAAALAVKAIDDPLSDVHGSATYRQRLVPVVVQRALQAATERAALA